jgi:phosphoribosylanthranilate isomerase
MMVKVKICGITNLEDARASVDAGCDALGFVFYKKSPRYIAPERARWIIKHLPPYIIKIGVFVNAREKSIRRIAKLCGLKILQFHGNESPQFCAKFKDYKIIKAFRVGDSIDLKELLKYKVFAYLFDTLIKLKIGGTGKKFNWELISRLDGLKCPIFLSGGLHAKNVKEAIKTVHPDWVDACTCLEMRPGKKDHKQVREFVSAAK